MKRTLVISLLILSTVIATAQTTTPPPTTTAPPSESKIRLNGYASYVFDDGFDVYSDANSYFNGTINGGLQWGAGVEFLLNPFFSLELLYFNKASDAPTTFRFGSLNEKYEVFDVNFNSILLGFNRLQTSSNGKVQGYGGLLVGMLITDLEVPSTGNSDSHTSFSWGGRMGANIWMSDKIGIKLQAQVLSATKATGGEFYFSYYGPVVFSTYTTLWQFGLGGGLTFKLGK